MNNLHIVTEQLKYVIEIMEAYELAPSYSNHQLRLAVMKRAIDVIEREFNPTLSLAAIRHYIETDALDRCTNVIFIIGAKSAWDITIEDKSATPEHINEIIGRLLYVLMHARQVLVKDEE